MFRMVMVTHSSFELLRHLPTIVAAVVLVCSLVLLLVLTCCEGGEKQSAADRDKSQSAHRRSDAEKFLYRTVSLIVGDWIQYNKSNKKYYIKIGDGTQDCPELKSGVLIILFIYAVVLVVFAIVTFFELFLFSTSSTCSTSSWTFCFLTGDNSAERIRNCTMLEGDVICYQLELNIVTAAGVIGGLFTIINFLTTSLNYRVIKYYCNSTKSSSEATQAEERNGISSSEENTCNCNGDNNSNEENNQPVLLVTMYIILLVSLLTMLVVCCILGAISQLKNDSPTSDVIVFIFQYVSVILAILFGAFIPMISVLCN